MSKRLIVYILAFFALAAVPAAQERAVAGTPLQDAIAKLTPEQQARLKAYDAAQISFRRRTDQYWRLTELKRKKRRAKLAAGKVLTEADYVKEQPAAYNGPPRPDDVMKLLPKPPPKPAEKHERMPVVADFLRFAQEQYGFTPDRVSEDDFMIAYAMEAVKLGLNKDQVVRLYAFETGGQGTHDLQSGYNPRTGHAASTALGYAQLLAPNSIEQVRKEGEEFATRLEREAQQSGVSENKARALVAKAAIVRRMVVDARKVHDGWGAHVAYAKTPKGLAMHTLNLDGDVGPWMQVVKLKGIKEYAAKRGMENLTAAQLEMMNLAGPGSGFEMMQPIGGKMPTSNYFERRAYGRNPVVAGETGSTLLAKIDKRMDVSAQRQGAQRFAIIFDGIAKKLAGARTQPALLTEPLSFLGIR